MQKKISPKVISLTLGILVLLFSVGFYIFAWTEPGSAPPAGNVPAPLNVGAIGQSKQGNLMLNTDGTLANGLLVPYGNVGIGTASPSSKLNVHDTTNMPSPPDINSQVPFKISDGSTAILMDSNQIESVGGPLYLNHRATGGAGQDINLVYGGGNVTVGSLTGSGDRMVVANATGTLSTQAIPGGGTIYTGSVCPAGYSQISNHYPGRTCTHFAGGTCTFAAGWGTGANRVSGQIPSDLTPYGYVMTTIPDIPGCIYCDYSGGSCGYMACYPTSIDRVLCEKL